MVCIAAFIVFAFLGIFSARWRHSAKSAWQCVGRKLTLRPCDTSFKEDIKNRLLGKLILTRPRLARFLDKWIEVVAAIFIILTIWSVVVVVSSLLNLFVYGTCTPARAESCSLGAEACSIETSSPSFWTTVKDGRPDKWVVNEVRSFAETVSLIPTRLRTWQASDYFGDNQSFYRTYDANKPTALEVIDPGCQFCATLFENIKAADFYTRYNLTYIAYPIPDATTRDGYKFANSKLISSYLEATKIYPLSDSNIPADWQMLERLFTEKQENGMRYQDTFNTLLSEDEAEKTLVTWLEEFGYSPTERARIQETARSEQVTQILARNKKIVEDKIHTVKIPTIIFNGNRHDGVMPADKLQ